MSISTLNCNFHILQRFCCLILATKRLNRLKKFQIYPQRPNTISGGLHAVFGRRFYGGSAASKSDSKDFTTSKDAVEASKVAATAELDLNVRQVCKVSHRNFLLYCYSNLDLETVIKLTNQVLAAYQTIPRRKSGAQRRLYVQKFIKCLNKQKDKIDVNQLSQWFTACMDLLTCQDLYTMLRVRHILNYDNSFETFRSSFGMENFESFSNVKRSKEIEDKALEENALKSKSAQRKLLMRHLKINKFKFLRDQNLTKVVYEASVDWVDDRLANSGVDPDKMALVYNLPFIKLDQLKPKLEEALSHFGDVVNVEILEDRLSPLATLDSLQSLGKNATPQPREKYSPLYAIVEFRSKEHRDNLCSQHLRVFGFLCCGRIIYPEFASYKHSLLLILYPPFRKMTQALQFVANVLVGLSEDAACTITHIPKRRHPGSTLVVAGDRSLVDLSIRTDVDALDSNGGGGGKLDNAKVRLEHSESLDPQWLVLRFKSFTHAYIARKLLYEATSDEPTSCVSFDTRRSIFHNGRYVDLALVHVPQPAGEHVSIKSWPFFSGQSDVVQ